MLSLRLVHSMVSTLNDCFRVDECAMSLSSPRPSTQAGVLVYPSGASLWMTMVRHSHRPCCCLTCHRVSCYQSAAFFWVSLRSPLRGTRARLICISWSFRARPTTPMVWQGKGAHPASSLSCVLLLKVNPCFWTYCLAYCSVSWLWNSSGGHVKNTAAGPGLSGTWRQMEGWALQWRALAPCSTTGWSFQLVMACSSFASRPRQLNNAYP